MKKIDAEILKKKLSENGLYPAIDIVEELQGYKTYKVTVRENVQGSYTVHDRPEPEIYATFVIRAGSMKQAKERANEKAKLRIRTKRCWYVVEVEESKGV